MTWNHCPPTSLSRSCDWGDNWEEKKTMEQHVFLDTGNVKTTKHYYRTKHYFHGVNGKPPISLSSLKSLCGKTKSPKQSPGQIRSAVQSSPVKKPCHTVSNQIPGTAPRSHTPGSQDPQSLGTRLAPYNLHLGEQQKLPSSSNSDASSQALCNTGWHRLMMNSSYECSICFQVTPGPRANYPIHFSSL